MSASVLYLCCTRAGYKFGFPKENSRRVRATPRSHLRGRCLSGPLSRSRNQLGPSLERKFETHNISRDVSRSTPYPECSTLIHRPRNCNPLFPYPFYLPLISCTVHARVSSNPSVRAGELSPTPLMGPLSKNSAGATRFAKDDADESCRTLINLRLNDCRCCTRVLAHRTEESRRSIRTSMRQVTFNY